MDVAIKLMLFQDGTSLQASSPPPSCPSTPCAGGDRGAGGASGPAGVSPAEQRTSERCQMILREAAVCCSMSHPNVVATYHYEVRAPDSHAPYTLNYRP